MKRPNKYASASAGTRAAHRRTIGSPGALTIAAAMARAGGIAAREMAQWMRREGCSPAEVKSAVWTPIRVRRDMLLYGQAVIVSSRA